MMLRRHLIPIAVVLALSLAVAGCTRRQLVPGIVAGTGAAMTTAGGIYRATLDTDEPFGETGGEVAGTTVLIFGGIGMLITGIVLSITLNHCEDNGDCWSGDVCEVRSHTCIDGDAARQAGATTSADDDAADEDERDSEDEDDSPPPRRSTPAADDDDDDDEDDEDDEDDDAEDSGEFDPGSYPG